MATPKPPTRITVSSGKNLTPRLMQAAPQEQTSIHSLILFGVVATPFIIVIIGLVIAALGNPS